MRIGTWNLQGRWDERHLDLVAAMGCEVLLLTEVAEKVALPWATLHTTALQMAPRRYWAAVASPHPLRPLADPHGATAMAEVNGVRVCSSILPWRSCGTRAPWVGSTTADKTLEAVSAIESVAPTVWGGDWNHALSGREWSGSQAGRRHLIATLDRLGLHVPTASAPHQIDGLLSIDHVAVPASWSTVAVERHGAVVDGTRISDHDAYVVEVVPDEAGARGSSSPQRPADRPL